MPAYLTVEKARGEARTMEVGAIGAGPFMIETLISGYSISPEAPRDEARKVRQHWLVYKGQLPDLYLLGSMERTLRAIQDRAEGCSWVFCDELARKQINDVDCPHLRELVKFWHIAHTFYEWDPNVVLTERLIEAVALATRALEEAGSAWAPRCREVADLMTWAGPGARMTIG